MSPDTIFIHADESCLGNQFQNRANPGGAAGLVEAWKDGEWQRRDYWISESDTTNNRMALRSAIEGLRLLRRRCKVHFISDSTYLVNGITQWLPNWKTNNWKRKRGPILNLELWKKLDAELQEHDVYPKWVRGHDGHPENEYANHLATRAAKTQMESGGLLPSQFQDWINGLREKGAYLDYFEFNEPATRFGDG